MHILGRFLASVIVLGLVAPTIAADRTVDEILKEFDAIKQPRTTDEYKTASAQKADLVAELQKVDPDNTKLKALLPQRWQALMVIEKNDLAISECEAVLASSKDETLKKDAAYMKAEGLIGKGADADKVIAAVDTFEKMSPKDPRMTRLLYVASQTIEDVAKLTLIEDRLLKELSSTRPDMLMKSTVAAARELRAKIGKPFELEFTEAIKGSPVAMKDLKGKVVVIDFWATWCGPCVAEIPNMKKIYAEYKDKGVEFIGVSLDQPRDKGGFDRLKEFVAKNAIEWPQYYDGKVDARAFAKSWSITFVPTVFLVDQDGNLYSAKARGKLEKMIPELLKKGKKDAGAGGQ
jgi:thiol-disulfide isomerase/thioredoxin